MRVEQLVVFAILMENNEGIVGKSPDYILKKFKTCELLKHIDWLKQELDPGNQVKLEKWVERWWK